ncbi:MAG TPA: UDP-N-acetyl-D-mannosamine dehydrogenase [Thermoanaerobaculia bacterium]|jgi:UDP-N-acetyl-D-mannosaminuronic acid dehydrogenase
MFEAKSICVIGLGYIGLPTASLLATKGYEVHGVDIRADIIDTINAGNIHIREPELDVLVRSAVQSGHLRASLEPKPSDVFILAVPTPFKEGHVPDLQYVEASSRAVAPHLRRGNLLILESTSPVGTTERVAKWVKEERPDLGDGELFIAHCPERVLPGQIIKELVSNDRIVGGINDASTEAAADFYRSFVSGEVLCTTSRTAELAKLTENTFRDVNIALANELSLVCDHLGVNVWELIELANHHPRVNVLQPGPGVGGHCIAVDPWFIVDSAPTHARLIRTAREVNDAKPSYVVQRVRSRARRIKEPVIACFGIAYKADIDDLRESPALEIAASLLEEQVGEVLIVEPYVKELPARLASHGGRLVTQEDALSRADIIVGLVDHRPFKRIDPAELAEKVVIDTKGMWR